MKYHWRLSGFGAALVLGLSLACACGFDDTLRAYLSRQFWLPFAKPAASFERPHVLRASAPFAGMTAAGGNSPLSALRSAYQNISHPVSTAFDPVLQRQAVEAARTDRTLTRREREEVDLIDAKIDMRAGEPGEPKYLASAKEKLERFLRTVRTPEFRSEARGWLARVLYLLNDHTRAGKIYLDELNRNGSNLSRESLLNSLQMVYGDDGDPELLTHLEAYFDTPEHASFAIQLMTNPHWVESWSDSPERLAESYARIRGLLEKHKGLFFAGQGASALTLLTMRTALRMGDPDTTRKIGEAVPDGAPVRREEDFNWMLGSACFLTRRFGEAERPLRALFQSAAATKSQRAAGAYGLCGVYRKTGNAAGQLQYALWLYTNSNDEGGWAEPSDISDLSVYWARSGWDLNLLLDAELSIETIRSFINANPNLAGIRLVKYSLAVRLSREDHYDEAAALYRSINANRRAPRIQKLGALYEAANRPDRSEQEKLEAQYELAEFVAANPDRIYFNDALWHGLQRYALNASSETRLTRAEQQDLIRGERELKDSQEERWRAYLILRDVVHQAGASPLGRRAATLALRCLRGISTDRFGREAEIRQADIELSRWLRRSSR